MENINWWKKVEYIFGYSGVEWEPINNVKILQKNYIAFLMISQ